ncbi:esterase [Actinocrispum sp. NPDC049592]|uniref:alpha/beta hydrolase n=1 Tax=Actinocrispum sp. NPDC049592 TaxID=3154835 RepID=UPI003445C693
MTGPAGTIPDVPAGQVVRTQVMSKARGRQVTVLTMAPDGYTAEELPKCVALHGRGGDAAWMANLGVPQFLTAAVRAGVPPFAVISVDGGADSYWIASDDDDPQAMLRTELGPFDAAFGISMGAFGCLRLARDLPLKAVAAISPAIFRSWPDAAKRNAFHTEAQWAGNEPLRHTQALQGKTLGVWCGREDPLVDAARALIDEVHPTHAAITHGAHDNAYWQRVLPEVVAFIGAALKS